MVVIQKFELACMYNKLLQQIYYEFLSVTTAC